MNRAVIFVLLTSVAACGPTTQSGTYSGYYQYGFEVMNFYPDGVDEIWWVQAGQPIPCLGSNPHADWPPLVHIQVRGITRSGWEKTSDRKFARDLYVTKVVSCRNATPDEYQQLGR